MAKEKNKKTQQIDSTLKSIENKQPIVNEEDVIPTIDQQISETHEATKEFFCNNFDKAFDLCKKRCDKTLYHTLSYATMCWMRAWLTFEKPEIDEAIDAVQKSLDFSASRKRQNGWFDYIQKTNYDTYTEEEIHAELAYADSILMLAMLSFIQDQSFISLIKGMYRFRCGYTAYKDCSIILAERSKWQTEATRREFESGVRAGNGSYNLAFSMCPPRILRVCEFIGFSGDEKVGITELKASADLDGTSRSPFATIMLLMTFMYIQAQNGWGEQNWSMIDCLLTSLTSNFSQSVFRPLFEGKYHQLKGDCEKSIKCFQQAIQTQSQWKQLHNACYWEIMWSNAIQQKWKEAADYADKLRQESRWSPCTFTYQYAVYLYMMNEDKNDELINKKIKELMSEVPKLKRRLAGKSTPREKFVCSKAERFGKKDGNLIAPAFEIFYIWNIFSLINSPPIIEPILAKIDQYLQLYTTKKENLLDNDERGILLLLKAVCLRHLNQLEESVECLQNISAKVDSISSNFYLLPSCDFETGINYMKMNDKVKAEEFLKKSMNNYSKYSGELIVHVRGYHALKALQISS